jgi:hypothetical protein
LRWCRGNAKDTRGTGFVVYEDILDAKNAVEHLTGFNVAGRHVFLIDHFFCSVWFLFELKFLSFSIAILSFSCCVDYSGI